MSLFPFSSAQPQASPHNVLAYIAYIYSFLNLLTKQSIEIKQNRLDSKYPTIFSENFQLCSIQGIGRNTKLGPLLYTFSHVDNEQLVHITNEKNNKTKTIALEVLLKAKEDLKELLSTQAQKQEINLHFLNTLLARLQLSLPTDYEKDVWRVSLLYQKKLFIKNLIMGTKGENKNLFADFQQIKNLNIISQKSESEFYFFKLDIPLGVALTLQEVEQINAVSGPYAGRIKLKMLEQKNIFLNFDKEQTLAQNEDIKASKFLLFNAYLALYAQKYWVASLGHFLPIFIKENPLGIEEDKKKDFYKKALQFYAYKANLGLPILKNIRQDKYVEEEIDGVLELYSFEQLVATLNIDSKERLNIQNYVVYNENYIPAYNRKLNSLSVLSKEKIFEYQNSYYIILEFSIFQKPYNASSLMIQDILETTQEMKRLQAKARTPLKNLKTKTFHISL